MGKKNEKKLAVVGLGYVGLPLAVEFEKVYPTLGFDVSKERIDKLKAHEDSTLEVSHEVLDQTTNLKFSSDPSSLSDCNIYIITVPTPIDSANRPNLIHLEKASKTVGHYLDKGDIVIYESTVYPGCTEEFCIPILEKESGLVFNRDFHCGYSPERINPGDKINTIKKIKKITSGSTAEVSLYIDELYGKIIDAGTFKASSIKVAEAAKVIENTQRDLNIALVNELSVIFEKLEIDTMDVLEAAGSKWNFLPFKPGIVGGHCIGVDPYYLTHKAEQLSYHPEVILAGRRINDNMASHVAKNFIQRMIKNEINIAGSTVGILGVTFKENCPDIRNSKVIDIINELKDWNINVIVQDEWADSSDVKIQYGLQLEKITKENPVDSLLVAVGHSDFRRLGAKDLRNLCKGETPVIADIKSLFNKEELEKEGFSVFRL